jgi:hypothetical protein
MDPARTVDKPLNDETVQQYAGKQEKQIPETG